MKHIIIAVILSILICPVVFAETSQVSQIDQTIETTSKWVGLGSEIGEALRAASIGFVSTVDGTAELTLIHLNKFMKSPAGKLTTFVIIWKLIGGDILQIVAGIILLTVTIKIIPTMWKKTCLPTEVLKNEKDGVKIYEQVEPLLDSVDNGLATFFYGLTLVVMIVSAVAMIGTAI